MASFKIKQEELNNGIYEVIRLELFAQGFLADIASFDVTTPVGLADYNAANELIVTDGGDLIEIFSTGGSQSRGDKEVNAIIIDRGTPEMAANGVGNDIDYDFNTGSGKYDKTIPSNMKYDVPFTITYFCKFNRLADIIEDIIRSVLKERAFIKSLDDSVTETGEFWLIRNGQFDTSGKNFIERGVTYLARNIDLIGPEDAGEITPFDFDQFEDEIVPTLDPDEELP